MSNLRQQLAALALHVRDPAKHPGPPGIESRRLKVYGDLLFNNIEGLLAGNFPVLRKTLGDADWRALIRRFFAGHGSRTPLFMEVGQELIAFLGTDAGLDPHRPWLAELAHYEWAELGLQLSDAAQPPHDPDGDLLDGVPMLSRLAWPLAYRWPVSSIGPDVQPTTPPVAPTLVLLRREPDGHVRFSTLSPLLFRLLELVDAHHDKSGRTLVRQLANEAGQEDFEAFLLQAAPMLVRLRAEGVLLGTRID